MKISEEYLKRKDKIISYLNSLQWTNNPLLSDCSKIYWSLCHYINTALMVSTSGECSDEFCGILSTIAELSPFKSVPKCIVEYALYKGIKNYFYIIGKVGPEFGDCDNNDEYSYRMPDELWNLTKKVIGWEGTDEK